MFSLLSCVDEETLQDRRKRKENVPPDPKSRDMVYAGRLSQICLLTTTTTTPFDSMTTAAVSTTTTTLNDHPFRLDDDERHMNAKHLQRTNSKQRGWRCKRFKYQFFFHVFLVCFLFFFFLFC
jgi:hypothetical protein